MNSRLTTPLRTIFEDKGATGVGTAINVEDFIHIIFQVATDGGDDATLTVKFQGSISDDAPDFSAAQSATNHWDYIQVVDLEDGSTIDGDTGFSVAGADDYRNFEININGLKWVTASITSRTQGELTVKIKTYN
jgi:hypothetical protein